MVETLWQKHLGGLRPACPIAEAMLADLKHGAVIGLDAPKRPRNRARNAFYWKMLSIVVENTEHWPSPEKLHEALKRHLGMVEEVVGIDGEIHLELRSTAFDRMSEPEFAAYLNRAINVICTEVIPGLDPMELRSESSRRSGVTAEGEPAPSRETRSWPST